jgi:hypothetical protein
MCGNMDAKYLRLVDLPILLLVVLISRISPYVNTFMIRVFKRNNTAVIILFSSELTGINKNDLKLAAS